jgi:hypothetical protein
VNAPFCRRTFPRYWSSVTCCAIRRFSRSTISRTPLRPSTSDVGTDDGGTICDYFDDDHSRASDSGKHELKLGPFMHK